MKQLLSWSVLKLILVLGATLAFAFACAAPPAAQTSATATTFLPAVAQSTAVVIALPTQTPAPQPTQTPIPQPTNVPGPIPVASYKVVASYPHDPQAFTEGLFYDNGVLYEGNGLNGKSDLRKVELETGKVLQSIPLSSEYFGEGIATLGDKIYQLTWQNHVGFVYDKNSLAQIKQFNYPSEGWGLTTDGKQLIMSDGTSTIHFIDPETLQETSSISVAGEGGGPVTKINELEYIDGEIYANLWQTDRIARINPTTGQVVAWIDLTGLLPPADRTQPVDVLNGIAYDPAAKRLFVTGKLWPKLFQIEIVNP